MHHNRITITLRDGRSREVGGRLRGRRPIKTLANLQSAYNGASNAHTKYLEFVKQADGEGHGKVASLFRVAVPSRVI